MGGHGDADTLWELSGLKMLQTNTRTDTTQAKSTQEELAGVRSEHLLPVPDWALNEFTPGPTKHSDNAKINTTRI